MSSARTSTLATLRGSIERIEAHGDAMRFNRVALGHASADAMLRGGLAVAAVHEVFAEGHQGAAATGFIAGLAGRITPRKPLVWVRQDFAELESGALSMSGLCRARPRSAPASSPCAPPMPRRRCAPPPTRSPAMRSALSCWKSGARRASSISSPAANSRSPRKPPASPLCCCGWRRSLRLRPRKPDGSCARRIRRPALPGGVGRAGVRRATRS